MVLPESGHREELEDPDPFEYLNDVELLGQALLDSLVKAYLTLATFEPWLITHAATQVRKHGECD